MHLSVSCPCGQSLEIDNHYAGMAVTCPTCNQLVTAPAAPRRMVARPLAPRHAADPGYEVVDEPTRNSPSRPRVVRDDEEDDDRPRRRSRRDDEDEDDRPRRRRRAGKDEPASIEARVFRGTVVGGLVAMLIAVVWFIVGLFGGIIFFYPPILFVIGMVGFVRGIVSRD